MMSPLNSGGGLSDRASPLAPDMFGYYQKEGNALQQRLGGGGKRLTTKAIGGHGLIHGGGGGISTSSTAGESGGLVPHNVSAPWRGKGGSKHSTPIHLGRVTNGCPGVLQNLPRMPAAKGEQTQGVWPLTTGGSREQNVEQSQCGPMGPCNCGGQRQRVGGARHGNGWPCDWVVRTCNTTGWAHRLRSTKAIGPNMVSTLPKTKRGRLRWGGGPKGGPRGLCDGMHPRRGPSPAWGPQPNATLGRVHQVLGDCLRTPNLDEAGLGNGDPSLGGPWRKQHVQPDAPTMQH